MIRRVWAVTHYTLLEEIRNRLLGATVLFAVILIYFGLVLTRLAAGFEDRFFRDISLAAMELFGLALVLQIAYRIVVADFKKGSSVEMFFVRPLRRTEYLLGRFKGVATVLFVGLGALAAVSAVTMIMRGYEVNALYWVAAAEVYLKLVIVLSIAFLAAAITTSQASYFVSTLLVYLSGNVVHLLKGLIEHAEGQGALTLAVIKPLTYLLPNFSLFSTGGAIDAIGAGAVVFHWSDFGISILYMYVYVFCAFSLTALLFARRKDLPA